MHERLENPGKPAVDILHFDGHSTFDEDTNTGSLLFERATGVKSNAVSADRLGPMLHQHHISLVILSACQSATQGEKPLGSVATGLLAQGIPSVLAMTHSVLVSTTKTLFSAFYQALGQGQTLGLALDHARAHLDSHPEKYLVRRDQNWVPLKLHDWFVPTLYQNGEDLPLLTIAAPPTLPCLRSNLNPRPAAGFFGRAYDLWRIERGFAGSARRISLTGFGGQGKTALAQKAGRWLLRTGLFRAAIFVDYARTQTLHALAVTVSTLATVLEQSLADPAAATAALRETPILVILDNLEALQAEPLKELLDASAAWSQAGDSRVLLTTRIPNFGHSTYPVADNVAHLRLPLVGLGNRDYPNDALAWFGELQKLPPIPERPTPTREKLVDLFDKVGFHPLSIWVVAA